MESLIKCGASEKHVPISLVLTRGHQQAADTAISLELQPLRGDTYIFALCRDLRLRVWATRVSAGQLLFEESEKGGHRVRSDV